MNSLGGDKELSDLLDFSAVGKLQKPLVKSVRLCYKRACGL